MCVCVYFFLSDAQDIEWTLSSSWEVVMRAHQTSNSLVVHPPETKTKTEKSNINNKAESRAVRIASASALCTPLRLHQSWAARGCLDHYEYDEFMEVIKVRSFIGRVSYGGGVKYAFESQPTATESKFLIISIDLPLYY